MIFSHIHFAPAPSSIIKEYEWVDPTNKSLGKTIKKTVISGLSGPCINRSFKNVKFIRLDQIMIPRYCRVVKLNTGAFALDQAFMINSDRYIILNIKELQNMNNCGTNTLIENGYFLPTDRVINEFFFSGYSPLNKVYNDNLLGNIDKLTIKFFTSDGEQLNLSMADETGKILNEHFDTDPANKNKINNINHKTFQIYMILPLEL